MNVQMPDGTIISDVPDGTTQSELLARYNRYQVAQLPDKDATVLGESAKSAELMAAAYKTGLGTLTGNTVAAVREGRQRRAELDKKYGVAPGLDEAIAAYDTAGGGVRGGISAAGETVSQIPVSLAGQAANLGSMYAGSKAGAAVGARIAGALPIPVLPAKIATTVGGAGVGAFVGAALSQFVPFYQENLEAQLKAQEDRGEEPDLNRAKAAAVAVMQGSTETAGKIFALGGNLVKRIVSGKTAQQAEKALVEAAQQSLAKAAGRSLPGAVGAGVTRAVLVELPVEMSQNIMTRAQAGQSLTDQDALNDYKNTIFETIKVAGGIGAGAGPLNRASARSELQARGLTQEGEPISPILSPEDRAAREAEQESVGYMRTQREAREAEKAAEAPFIGQKETDAGQFGLNLEGGKRVSPDETVQGAPLPERRAGFDAYGRPKKAVEQYDEYGRPVTPEVDQYGLRVEPAEPTTPAAITSAPTAITQALDATQPVQQHRAEVAALTQRLAETPDTIANRPIVRQITGRIGELNKLIKSAEATPVGTQGELPVVPSAEPAPTEAAPPAAAPQSTSALVKAAGIPASAPIAQQLKKLDLTQQADRTAAAQYIAQALENKNVRPDTKTAIQAFYDQHIAQPAAATQGGLDLGEPQPLAQAPAAPATPIVPPAPPVAVTPDTAPPVIDATVWKALGIGPTAAIRRNPDVNGKDITNPTDAAFVRQALEAYRDATRSDRIKANIDKYLARFPAPAPAAPTPPPMTPVEQRVASGQIDAWALTLNPFKGISDVVYAANNIGLLRDQRTDGTYVYIPVINGMTPNDVKNLDITNYSPSQARNLVGVTQQQYNELLEARTAIETRENALYSQFPDGPFTNATNNVVATEGVDPRYTQYLTALMQKLGMGNINVFLVNGNDLLGNKDKYMLHGAYGTLEQIGDRGNTLMLPIPQAYGTLVPFGPRLDTFAIYLSPTLSEEMAQEVITHEFGHGLEYAAFIHAPEATKTAIVKEYLAWEASTKNMTIEQLIESLRNREVSTVSLAKVSAADRAKPATAMGKVEYFTSFAEWFADNVSRWASTDAKAVGVVEQFFKALATKLRALVQAVTGKQFLPNSAVADYLNSMGPANPIVWQGVVADKMNKIVRKPYRLESAITTKLQAPNTPEFQKWFEGSKVVDADGNPIRLYHGTDQDISVFKPSKEGGLGKGIYMTADPEFAGGYAMESAFGDKRKGGSNVMPLYANISNPIQITYAYGQAPATQVLQALGVSQDKAIDIVEKAYETKGNLTTELFSRAKKQGYDGIIYLNEDGSIREALAFEPNQIKSAFNQTPTESVDISNLDQLVDQKQMDDSVIVQTAQSVNTPVGQLTPNTLATINQAPSQAQRTAMTQFALMFAKGDTDFSDKLRQKTVDVFAPVASKLGALFDKGVRNSFGDVNPVQYIRQAFDHARVALDVFNQGGLRMNKDGFWESFALKDANGKEMSARQVINEIDALAKKNNEAFIVTKAKVATVLEGMRLYDLRKENAELEKVAKAQEADNDFDAADKTREKKFPLHMSFAEIDALEQTFRASPDLQEIQRIMNASRESVVDAMVTSGRISKDRGDFWKSVINYVPFDRIQDVFEDISLTQRPARKGITSLGELPALRGSFERPVANVVDNYMGTMAWMVEQSMRNSASVRVLNLMSQVGMAKKLPSMNQATDTHKVLPKLYENGEPVYFEVESPYDFAAFVQAPEITSGVLKFMGMSSRLLRTTITATPMFAIKQVIDDAQRVLFYSGVKNPSVALATLFKHFPRAWFGAWFGKESAIERKLISLGIIGDYDFNPTNPIETLEYQTGARERGGVKWVINKLEQVTKASDMAARLAVYEQTLKETGDPAVAQVRARELINFNRRGSSTAMRTLTHVVPFFGAYAQGLDLMYRGFTGKDSSMGLSKSAARTYFISRIAMMSAMGFLYAWSMEDDEQYEDLTDEIRDRNWILPKSINDSFPVKLSVPSELGFIFKSIPERIVSYMKAASKGEDQGVGHAVMSTLKDAARNYGTVPIPTMIKPILENVTNYSTFTHREIVPKAMQERPAALQYTSNTSEIAKAIGKSADVSPLKVDNWIRGTFGLMGASTLLMADAMMNPARPDRSLAQLPFLNIALVNPAGSRVKDEFYDFRQKVTEAVAAKNMLEKENPVKYAEFVEKNYHLLAAAPYINQKLKTLSELRATREMFTHLQGMESSEKRKQIDEINKIEKIILSDMRTMRSAIQKAAPK